MCLKTLLLTVYTVLLTVKFGLNMKTSCREMLLNGQFNFTNETIDEYFNGMDKLNKIRARMLGRVDYDIPSFEHAANKTETAKPWMIPYLFEGDIVLTSDQLNDIINHNEFELYKKEIKEGATQFYETRKKRTLTSITALWWTDFPIPYFIDSDVDRNAIAAGVQNWIDNTCLTFTEVANASAYPAALEFINGDGCYSNIGRVGGIQQISIGYGCNVGGIVSHEIGHSLGYYHEHSRFDRDSYVTIVTANIPQAYLSQFSKTSPDSMITFGVQYDLGSVMHYDPFAFSSNGSATISTDDQNYQDTIGQRINLSFSDIKKMNFAYCNQTCSTQLDCQRNGYTDPKNCSRCRCPDGIGGDSCDQALATETNCGDINHRATNKTKFLNNNGTGSCNYLLRAPSNSRILILIQSFVFSPITPCDTSYLEIKYLQDFGTTGPRLCTTIRNPIIISESEEVVILYRGTSSSHNFALSYIIVPPPNNATEELTSSELTPSIERQNVETTTQIIDETTTPTPTTTPTTTTTTTTSTTSTTTTTTETTSTTTPTTTTTFLTTMLSTTTDTTTLPPTTTTTTPTSTTDTTTPKPTTSLTDANTPRITDKYIIASSSAGPDSSLPLSTNGPTTESISTNYPKTEKFTTSDEHETTPIQSSIQSTSDSTTPTTTTNTQKPGKLKQILNSRSISWAGFIFTLFGALEKKYMTTLLPIGITTGITPTTIGTVTTTTTPPFFAEDPPMYKMPKENLSDTVPDTSTQNSNSDLTLLGKLLNGKK